LPSTTPIDINLQDLNTNVSSHVAAICLLHDQSALAVRTPAEDVASRTSVMTDLVDQYLSLGRLQRTAATTYPEIQERFPHAALVVLFHPYTPAEIIHLAQLGQRVPPGVTRHIIGGRALRLNYPLLSLRSNESLEAKNVTLQTWLHERFTNRDIRYYAESTYLFDE
ncbi:MAG: hypothetical protein GYB68_00280, partial [Chloroflexi bacterium]|nr:hypothetical protein [Chloroflexota bacterium]